MTVGELQELRNYLNQMVDASGYPIEIFLKKEFNGYKEMVELYEITKQGIRNCLNEDDYETNIIGASGFIVLQSLNYGNAKWIRQEELQDVFEISEEAITMGIVAADGIKAWGKIFDVLSKELGDIIEIDIETSMEKICSHTRKLVIDLGNILEDGSRKDVEDIFIASEVILDEMIHVIKKLQYNVKNLRRLFEINL